jgi:hypothetical protein
MILEFFTYPTPKKLHWIISIHIATKAGIRKRGMIYVGRLDNVLLIRVIRLPLEIHHFPSGQFAINLLFYIIPNSFGLKATPPKGRPRYFKGK